MRAERKETEPVQPILLGRETFLGHTWIYELKGGVQYEDGRISVGIWLSPEHHVDLTNVVVSNVYVGTKAQVRERAVGAIRHWPTIRGLIQQYLGKGVVVPEEAPDPRQLEIFPPER